jgi:hypothetical protein
MSDMWREFWRLVALPLIWVPLIGSASLASAQTTTILNFEDLSPTGLFQPMPSGYGGINWSDVFWPYDAPQPPFNPKSGIVRIASNRVPRLDDPIPRGQFQFVTPDQVFNGAWFAGPNPPQLVEVQFLLYNDGILVHSSAILQVSPVPTFLESGYSGPVDAVTILGKEGEYVFDDLSYSTPPAIIISIDIKPGSFPNAINFNSAGVVPVALLSSPTFDATQVDPATVTLAGAQVKMIGKGDRNACAVEDSNSDGLLDLVCHVTTAQFLIEPGDSVAVLEARTVNGQQIRGQDSIRIVP